MNSTFPQPIAPEPHDRPDAEQTALALLLEAADRAIEDGIAHARRDDPHAFTTLAARFDRKRARRKLVIDYRADGLVDITCELHGTQDGKPVAAALFTTRVQGPVPWEALQ